MSTPTIVANGKPIETKLPWFVEQFLVAQGLLPRSVVVEHSGKLSLLHHQTRFLPPLARSRSFAP